MRWRSGRGRWPETTRGSAPGGATLNPRSLMTCHASGFHSRQASPASSARTPLTTSGTAPNTNGMPSERVSSRSTFQRESPPMTGAPRAKTPRPRATARCNAPSCAGPRPRARKTAPYSSEVPHPTLAARPGHGVARIAPNWTISGQCRLPRDLGGTRAARPLFQPAIRPTLGRLAEDGMRRRTGLAVLALGAALAAFAAYPRDAASVLSALAAQRGPQWADAHDVDVELILAVDVSYSMDPDEQALQREGYVSALTSPEFLTALKTSQEPNKAADDNLPAAPYERMVSG